MTTMSNALYSKLNDTDLERGLDIQQDAPPVYPPGPQGGGRRMNYVFNPSWPIKGKSAKAVGRACASKEETLDVVKAAFPDLQAYPDDRVSFHIFTEGEGPHKSYSKLLDDGWVDIASHPPSSMLVQIDDGPGDARRRNIYIWSMVLVGPMVFLVFITTFMYFMA